MGKGWIKWTDFTCCSKNCNLQILSCWFCMNFFGGQCNAIADLIFNGGIFRLVWWPRNWCKHWITIPGSDCLCDKWSQMRSQVVPKKHAVWISVYHMSRNTVRLNACTHVIDKTCKGQSRCPSCLHDSAPASWHCNTTWHVVRKSRIARFDCK